MKAVLSEMDLRESIRRALMKSLMMEADGNASVDQRLEEIGQSLYDIKEKVYIQSPDGKDFKFSPGQREDFKFFGVTQDIIFKPVSPLTIEQFFGEAGARARAAVNAYTTKDLKETINSESIENSTRIIVVPGTSDSSAASQGKGVDFIILRITDDGKISDIFPGYSPKQVGSFVVGAIQSKLKVGLGSIEGPFPKEVQSKVDALLSVGESS